MTEQKNIQSQDETIIKKIATVFCIFGGVIVLMPTLFFIFFDTFYKTPFLRALPDRSPWLLISIILLIAGGLLLKQLPGKLPDFIRTFLINFVILNIFQIILFSIETIRYINEDIAEDMAIAFFSYSFVIFIFCFLPAALKIGLKLSNKHLIIFTTILGVTLLIEIIFKLGYNYWTFLAFAVLLPFFALFLKKRATR